jgi:fructose-1,6-bisphosphatase I/sedoheptulose-1,7-bisphosphatase
MKGFGETPLAPPRLTLTKYLIQERRRFPEATGDFNSVLFDVAMACKLIAAAVSRGMLAASAAAGAINVQGERQEPLDLLANDTMLRCCGASGALAALASEEMEEIVPLAGDSPNGRYLLAFDPLDGSSNIDVNVAVGTIFSVLRAEDPGTPPTAAAFLQPGIRQVAAGYALYGPAAMLVLTIGRGTQGFTFDRDIGEFVLTHPSLAIPADTREFAINTSNTRFWEPPVQRYVGECLAGRSGVRGADFNMRWIASLVAEVHRILLRGGVFMYPRDTKDPLKAGRLRLLYEANPMAMLVEQAQGAASTGRARILDVAPAVLHQRIPVILGSRNEVERIAQYHREFDAGLDKPFESPLFNSRTLFRQASL